MEAYPVPGSSGQLPRPGPVPLPSLQAATGGSAAVLPPGGRATRLTPHCREALLRLLHPLARTVEVIGQGDGRILREDGPENVDTYDHCLPG